MFPVQIYDFLIEVRQRVRDKFRGFIVPPTTLEDFLRRLEERRSKKAGEGMPFKQHPFLMHSQQFDGHAFLSVYEFIQDYPDLVTAAELDLILSNYPELKRKLENAKRYSSSPSPSI